VFGKFQQFGPVADPDNKGTGLGLADFKGDRPAFTRDVSVQSAIDKGSTFSFSLPTYAPTWRSSIISENRISESRETFLAFCIRVHEKTGS